MASVTHYAALADYLAMGADRSLVKLHRHYDAGAVEKAPCLRTLATWSTLYRWQAAVAEHDRIVGEALILKTRDAAIDRGFDRVDALSVLAQSCLETVTKIQIDPAAIKVSDLRALASTAIDAIKMVEVLTGGVAERREDRSKGIAEEAIVLLREIEEQKRHRNEPQRLREGAGAIDTARRLI